MQKCCYETGKRLSNIQRQKIEEKGFYVYACRSWDEGGGCSLEKRVIVNHETDVILNFKPHETEPCVVTYDYYNWLDENDIALDDEPFASVKNIINY